jgi:hypothetical protein
MDAGGRCTAVPVPPAFCHKVVCHPYASLAASSAATIASTQGVCQGDPCEGKGRWRSPLQGPLEELQELDLAQPLAHVDDIFLQGTRGVVEAAFPPSRVHPPGTLGPAGHAVQVLGLLYSGSGQPGSVSCTGYAACTQRDHGSCFSSRGGCFCGSPCTGVHIQGMPSRGCAGWAPLPTQDRWLLLQGFLQLRVVHLPWVDE